VQCGKGKGLDVLIGWREEGIFVRKGKRVRPVGVVSRVSRVFCICRRVTEGRSELWELLTDWSIRRQSTGRLPKLRNGKKKWERFSTHHAATGELKLLITTTGGEMGAGNSSGKRARQGNDVRKKKGPPKAAQSKEACP